MFTVERSWYLPCNDQILFHDNRDKHSMKEQYPGHDENKHQIFTMQSSCLTMVVITGKHSDAYKTRGPATTGTFSPSNSAKDAF